jgi:hypothetical protein
MILKILHFFIGHSWSEWEEPENSKPAYEGERWESRSCTCGKYEERDL